MYQKLRPSEDETNEDQIYVINKMLNQIKKTIKKVPKDRKFMIEENEKLINIAERILYFNKLNHQDKA